MENTQENTQGNETVTEPTGKKKGRGKTRAAKERAQEAYNTLLAWFTTFATIERTEYVEAYQRVTDADAMTLVKEALAWVPDDFKAPSSAVSADWTPTEGMWVYIHKAEVLADLADEFDTSADDLAETPFLITDAKCTSAEDAKRKHYKLTLINIAGDRASRIQKSVLAPAGEVNEEMQEFGKATMADVLRKRAERAERKAREALLKKQAKK